MNKKKISLIIGTALTMGVGQMAMADSSSSWGRWDADAKSNSGSDQGTQVAAGASSGRSTQKGQSSEATQKGQGGDQDGQTTSTGQGADDAGVQTVADAGGGDDMGGDGMYGDDGVDQELADTGMDDTNADPMPTDVIDTSVIEESTQNETIVELIPEGETGWVVYSSVYADCGSDVCSNASVSKSSSMAMEEVTDTAGAVVGYSVSVETTDSATGTAMKHTPTDDGMLTFDPYDDSTFTTVNVDETTDFGGSGEATATAEVTADPVADWWWGDTSDYAFGGEWVSSAEAGEFIAGERSSSDDMSGAKVYLGEGYDTVAYVKINNDNYTWSGKFYSDAMVLDSEIDGLRGFKASGSAVQADFSTTSITSLDYQGNAVGSATGSVKGSIFGPGAEVGGGMYSLEIDGTEEYADLFFLYGPTPDEDIEALATGSTELFYEGEGFNTDYMQMTVNFGAGTWDGEFYNGDMFDDPVNYPKGFAAEGTIDGADFISDSGSLEALDFDGNLADGTVTGSVEGSFFGPDASSGYGEYDVNVSGNIGGVAVNEDYEGEFAMFESEEGLQQACWWIKAPADALQKLFGNSCRSEVALRLWSCKARWGRK